MAPPERASKVQIDTPALSQSVSHTQARAIHDTIRAASRTNSATTTPTGMSVMPRAAAITPATTVRSDTARFGGSCGTRAVRISRSLNATLGTRRGTASNASRNARSARSPSSARSAAKNLASASSESGSVTSALPSFSRRADALPTNRSHAGVKPCPTCLDRDEQFTLRVVPGAGFSSARRAPAGFPQLAGQRLPGAVQERLYRPERYAHHLRDLRVVQVFLVPQHDDTPVLGP